MFKILGKIARKYFNGDSRRGPRRDFLMKELERNGCTPRLDRFGNIWVVKGSGSPVRLFSSHMDVDPRIRKVSFSAKKNGRGTEFRGILDNSVGCVVNLELAKRGPKKGTAIYIFTASEEIDRINPRLFARSAKEIVKIVKEQKIRLDLCVAIDVTYPGLLMKQSEIDWSVGYDKIFDAKDKTHCYLDGFSKAKEGKIGGKLVRRFGDKRISIRKFHGHDEAFIYSRIAPSFAFGPVVFGHFDQPDQHMPASHLKSALRFLRAV
jgi:hypothetical protein